ncbi:MAG: hypothetical protein LYZ69_06075 [Nitrososphaerales archaeon]|nr:hypothetical protein [Nitrososphaerales archaeon]
MGWGLKIGLFVFALVAIGFGAWIIAIPILAFLFIPPLLPKRKAPREQNQKVGSTGRRRMPGLKLLGGILVALSVVAFVSGGIFSPIVLVVAGFAILFRPNFGSGLSSRVKPVDDSVLLRGRFVPFRWFAVAEAKFATRDPEGALSGIDGKLLLLPAPTPRVLLIFSVASLRRGGAEKDILGCMKAAARTLGTLGVYLLPLNSEDAFELSKLGTKQTGQQVSGLRDFASSADYGPLMVEAGGGYVGRFEIYEWEAPGKGGNSAFSEPGRRLGDSLLLRNLLQAVMVRTGTPQPDRYTAFLSSMAATAGETLGQRMTQAAEGSDGQVVLVASVGSPQVEMSKAQLRFLTNVYS